MPPARIAPALAITALALAAHADTTLVSPNVYAIDEGVDFTISNLGASSFLFTWSDDSGTFTDIEDPTIILSAGQTYTFARTTGAHPFSITDDTLPTTGTDGAYDRDTTDITVMDAATLQPMDDFIADPAPTTDMIVWSLETDDAGDYFYTCRVTFHTGMTGRIEVVAPTACSPADIDADGDVDPDDIAAFVTNFTDAVPDNADVDADGDEDPDDIAAFVTNFVLGC